MTFETDLCADHRGMFSDLAGLNRRFIQMLSDAAGAHSTAFSACDVALGERLAELTDGQLDRIAACPYALFDMHFADPDFWSTDSNLVPPAATPHDRHSFFLAALFFARALTLTSRELFFLFFGKSDEVAARLARFDLATLADLGVLRADRVSARLPGHPRFWPDLIDFVSDGSAAQYQAAQTVGMQLNAAGCRARG